MSHESIIQVNDASFEDKVVNHSAPVLVDFWAEWCPPCKALAPLLDEIAEEYNGKLVIAKMDVDQSPQTPPKYGIRGIPTLILFENGKVTATQVGALNKSQLKAFLDSHL
jgi:thioredoxin 1